MNMRNDHLDQHVYIAEAQGFEFDILDRLRPVDTRC
jgi:hypothetical protein